MPKYDSKMHTRKQIWWIFDRNTPKYSTKNPFSHTNKKKRICKCTKTKIQINSPKNDPKMHTQNPIRWIFDRNTTKYSIKNPFTNIQHENNHTFETRFAHNSAQNTKKINKKMQWSKNHKKNHSNFILDKFRSQNRIKIAWKYWRAKITSGCHENCNQTDRLAAFLFDSSNWKTLAILFFLISVAFVRMNVYNEY